PDHFWWSAAFSHRSRKNMAPVNGRSQPSASEYRTNGQPPFGGAESERGCQRQAMNLGNCMTWVDLVRRETESATTPSRCVFSGELQSFYGLFPERYDRCCMSVMTIGIFPSR